MGDPVAPIAPKPVTVPGPIQGPAPAAPQAQTPNLGYDPANTTNSYSAVYDDPANTPKQAALALGKKTAAIASDIEKESNYDVDKAIKVTKTTESTGFLGAGAGKHVLTLEKPGVPKQTFEWSKDEKEPTAKINDWLNQQNIPKGERNFEVASVKADDIKPMLNALGGADNIHIKEVPKDSGTVDLDRARFAYGDSSGKFVVKRDGTNVIANLGESQNELKIKGTTANDTLVSEWTGAPTTLDGGDGNDILLGIGNGNSTFKIQDTSGQNWLSALNTGSSSKITTGARSRSNRIDVSGSKVEVDSGGNADTIKLGEGDHKVSVSGSSARVIQSTSATKNYSIDDLNIKNKNSVVGIAKEDIVNVNGEQKVAYNEAPQIYRGSGGGVFGGSPQRLYDGTESSASAITQSADDAYNKQIGLFVGGSILVGLLAAYSSRNSDDSGGGFGGFGGGFGGGGFDSGGFGSRYAYLHEKRNSRFA